MPEVPTITYGTYLQLDRLLGAQLPPDLAKAVAEPGALRKHLHHDEMVFIVVHQAFELWFKLVLHELSYARDLLGRIALAGETSRSERVPERDVPVVVATIERVNEVFRIATQQFRVIETMHPAHFLQFRDAITPASGFQSVQFREMEVLAGLPEAQREGQGGGSYALQLDARERARLEKRIADMTLKAALMDWLRRTPIEQAYPRFAEDYAAAFDRYVDEQIALQARNPHTTAPERAAAKVRFDALKAAMREYFFGPRAEEIKAHRAFMFITTYREEPLLRWPSLLLDRLVEFEQNFREFRFRHARMVERMIGSRTGTGGSPGLAYLDQTASYRIFGNLLEARNFLIARTWLGDVPHPEVLRFRFGD
jgi:tryptophan 2,3-dioxygenase